jgi:hypothetical protein
MLRILTQRRWVCCHPAGECQPKLRALALLLTVWCCQALAVRHCRAQRDRWCPQQQVLQPLAVCHCRCCSSAEYCQQQCQCSQQQMLKPLHPAGVHWRCCSLALLRGVQVLAQRAVAMLLVAAVGGGCRQSCSRPVLAVGQTQSWEDASCSNNSSAAHHMSCWVCPERGSRLLLLMYRKRQMDSITRCY